MRLKALARLAQSETEAAHAALRKEFDKVAASLAVETKYELLEQHLKELDAIGHRSSNVVVDILLTFIRTIESREITYSQQDPLFENEIRKYNNASSLIVRAVEVLIRLRYLETRSILHALMNLSKHASENVRTKSVEGLKALADYDIDVFYGDEKQPGIGAAPQKQIIDEIEAFEDIDLKQHFPLVLTLIESLLSPTVQGTSSSYKSVTWSQSATPAVPTVADIRLRSVELLRRIYGIASTVSEKLEVLFGLGNATSAHVVGRSNEDTINMIVRDTINVLNFFLILIQTEHLQIVQKIESKSYWIYFHAIRSEIETVALAVETAIAQHSEYQIYKILIGFEGIFGDWSELRTSDSHWEEADKFRKVKALEYAESITPENYAEWRQRILDFAETQSDDLATFPVFYQFLGSFAATQPILALKLISDDSERIDKFLIPILRSLWAGPQKSATKRLVESWIEQGRYLYPATKQFLGNEHFDRDLLALLLREATELKDFQTVSLVMAVAASNYDSSKTFLIDELFLPALKILTEHSNVNWILDLWFRRETRTIIEHLSERDLDLVLGNLLALEKIDYHAEEILYLIAQKVPDKVLQFLCQRLVTHSQNRKSVFDAIPHTLHKLNEPLSKLPREAVRVVREQYDGDYSMFIYRGARLLKIIFPQFPSEFEAELINVVRVGGDTNIEFVLAVLRNYGGQTSIHQVCKEIIKSVPTDSIFRSDVAIALETTGVVEGEFGFAEAYERKKNEVKDWMTDPDEKLQEFAKWYIANLEQMSVTERKRAEERIALRKYRYGDEE